MQVRNTRKKLKCLDLFCGAGGASTGLHHAGFEVTGVDIKPQPRYPFRFIQGDALVQDLSPYDFVWASPPCQAYSSLRHMVNSRSHEKLIPVVRNLLEAWGGGPWVIENVGGARYELQHPIMLCGSMFGLSSHGYQVQRHRYFESNVSVTTPGICVHSQPTMGIYGAKVRDAAKEKQHYAKPKATRGTPSGVCLPNTWGLEAMGVTWMNMREASESIPPVYSEHIGRQVIAACESRAYRGGQG